MRKMKSWTNRTGFQLMRLNSPAFLVFWVVMANSRDTVYPVLRFLYCDVLFTYPAFVRTVASLSHGPSRIHARTEYDKALTVTGSTEGKVPEILTEGHAPTPLLGVVQDKYSL